MNNIEKIRAGSLIGNVVLLFTTFLFLWLWLHKPCPPCYEAGQTVIVHDTIYPKDTTLKLISVKVPEAFRTVRTKKLFSKVNETKVKVDTIRITNCDTTIILPVCDEVMYYSDTIKGEDCKAVINDTISKNRITGRSVWMANLKPEIRTTETVVKRERWKVYVGASFTINPKDKTRWGIGPSALLTIPKVGGISYTFDAKNFSHSGTFYALIRFRK